jgi:hypothetical protein
MRNNANDTTLKRNYIQKYQFLIKEYELVKARKHPSFRFVKDFYAHHNTCAQVFLKYYGRYKQSLDENALLPGKRGPKWKTRRSLPQIEADIVDARRKGNNRYEICHILKPKWGDKTPCASTVYRVSKRHKLNRLKPPMIEEKRKIIKHKAGELGHFDCHHLSKDMIAGAPERRYLVCIVDSYSRIAWAEVVHDIKALSVMFASMRCLQYLSQHYGITFEEMLSDNGPEFGPKNSQNSMAHPFGRLMFEMGIKHRHTRPYRPQTNGKVERFWRTLNEDLIEGTYFEDEADFTNQLQEYLVYYNHARPHQGINGKTPAQML